MLDPWSERSVSDLPPLANQVEIMAPNVFEYDEPQRVVSTRQEGPVHFHVYQHDLRLIFRTPSRNELLVYVGYTPHLRRMIVFGVDFFTYHNPTITLNPATGIGYMFINGERIPAERVRSGLDRPDTQRRGCEEERQRWAGNKRN